MSPSKLVVYTQTSNSHPLYYLLLPHLMCTYVCVVQFGKAGHCAAKLYVPQDQEASNTPFFLLPHIRHAMQNIKSKLLKVSHNELVLSSHTFHQIFEQECNSRNIYCVSQLPGSMLELSHIYMILSSQQSFGQHHVIPILQIRKLKFRKVKQYVQINPPQRSLDPKCPGLATYNASAGPSVPSSNPRSNHCSPNTPPLSSLHAFAWPEMTHMDFLPMNALLTFLLKFHLQPKDQALISSQDKLFSLLLSYGTYFAHRSQNVLHLTCIIRFVLVVWGLCFFRLHISSKHLIQFT